MKRSKFTIFICVCLALLSLGLFNNFGYPERHLITNISLVILFILGIITIYSIWNKLKWAPIIFLICMGYTIIDSFIFHFTYKKYSIFMPIASAVIIILCIKAAFNKLKADINK